MWSPTAHSSDLVIFTPVFLLTPAVLPRPLNLLPGVSSSIIFALKVLAESVSCGTQPKPVFWGDRERYGHAGRLYMVFMSMKVRGEDSRAI